MIIYIYIYIRKAGRHPRRGRTSTRSCRYWYSFVIVCIIIVTIIIIIIIIIVITVEYIMLCYIICDLEASLSWPACEYVGLDIDEGQLSGA